MKLIYKLSNQATVEIEGGTQAEVFKELAAAHEIFGIDACGVCQGNNVYPRVRNVDDNFYHEMVCGDPKCRAVLAFGANKKGGGLFPQRRASKSHAEVKAGRLSEGDWLPNGGWYRWEGK